MMDVRKYYKSKLIQLENEEKSQKRKLKTLGFTRLLLFVAIVLAVFVLVPKSMLTGIGLSIFCSVLFFVIVKVYNRWNDKNKHTRALISINEDELKALDHDYSGFDPGKEFIDEEHPYSYDMDLYGEGSVFQYLNRTVTVKGKAYLSQLLSKTSMDAETITSRQEALKELSQMMDLLQDFRASGMLLTDESSDILLLKEWIRKPYHYASKKSMVFMARALPPATVLSILLAVLFPMFKIIPIVLVLLNFIIVGARASHSSAEHGLISKRLNALKKYALLLSTIEKGDYSVSRLKLLFNTLISGPDSAARSILRLSKIVSAFDNRLNFIAAFFLQGIFLWDIQCMIRLDRWRKFQASYFDEWMDKLAEFDVLTSLSTFAFNHPAYVYPGISKTQVLQTKQIGHFLIPSAQRVCNDFEIAKKGEFIIVTGANMAGKSTFLRTVATNLVMAMTGAPVCADYFVFKPMPIFSSMRTTDSLNKNESYFYAELKRLKEMLDRLKKGEDLFIILDEILKGTNSFDKQKGSRSALKQIVKYKGTGIIATHDLELAGLERELPQQIKNHCFEIEIDKTDISFDYLLRNGITTKMNASLLMHQMGILEE